MVPGMRTVKPPKAPKSKVRPILPKHQALILQNDYRMKGRKFRVYMNNNWWKVIIYAILLGLGYMHGPGVVDQYVDWEEVLNAPHPHRGAFGPDGKLGYVHDVHYFKDNAKRFSFFPREGKGENICYRRFGNLDEGPFGLKALAKIEVVPPSPDMKKVLCIVMTKSERHEILVSIKETYGPRCDGFLASSDKTDPELGAVYISNLGPTNDGNMW